MRRVYVTAESVRAPARPQTWTAENGVRRSRFTGGPDDPEESDWRASYLELNDVMVRSWGEIVASSMGHWFPLNWWVAAGPGLALVFTVVAVSIEGDALRDVFDPRGLP